jgi:hypothetical protein
MTTELLEQHEAEELEGYEMAERILDEAAAIGREQGRVEALADVEDTIVDALDELEERVVRSMTTFGTWLSDLHIKLDRIEAQVLRKHEPEAVADFDASDLLALDEEADQAETVRGHVQAATEALASALFEFGEAPSAAREAQAEAEDNVEYAYWSLMKALADTSEWLYEVNQVKAEMLEVAS